MKQRSAAPSGYTYQDGHPNGGLCPELLGRLLEKLKLGRYEPGQGRFKFYPRISDDEGDSSGGSIGYTGGMLFGGGGLSGSTGPSFGGGSSSGSSSLGGGGAWSGGTRSGFKDSPRLRFAKSFLVGQHYPDALSITTFSATAIGPFGGFELNSNITFYILNGNDIGTIGDAEIDFGGGIGPDGILGGAIGWDADVSFYTVTEYYYFGDINNFIIANLEGARDNYTIGLSYFVEVGLGISYMPQKNGDYILAVSKIIGISPPGPSFNFNKGTTGKIKKRTK